jgi:uncharacterized damage-inducible protein DinB
MTKIFTKLFLRDLEKLKTEITSYKDEKKMWDVSSDTCLSGRRVKNSSGNLCLHICGNLQHFIGATLGNSGYARKRDLEFSKKNVPVSEMVKEIEKTLEVVEQTLSELNEEKLDEIYPINVFGEEMTTGFFLTHLTTHLSYHLGQINYHRRLLDT